MKIDNIDITAQLFALQDKAYADFQSKLLPTVPRETVIGVRTPDLRKIGTLMRYFLSRKSSNDSCLDEAFLPEYLEWVESIKSDEYYIRMMQAWFFATALAKQWDATLPYIERHRLEKDTHNKTIQKAVESFRITDEQKALLKTLRR